MLKTVREGWMLGWPNVGLIAVGAKKGAVNQGINGDSPRSWLGFSAEISREVVKSRNQIRFNMVFNINT